MVRARTGLCLIVFLFPVSCNLGRVEEGSPTVKILPRNDTEGSNKNKILNVKFSLSPPSKLPVTVTFSTVDSTAKAGKDFIPITDGKIVFNPGETIKSADVELISDTITEYTEQFKLQITKVENALGTGQSLTITISDDDFPKITLASDGYISSRSIPGLNLIFDDEFNDTSLNIYSWNYNLGATQWRQQLQSYTFSDQNIFLSQGKLNLTARINGHDYSSAGINTLNLFRIKYGLIQVRAKMPEGTGLWPSIWLLGTTFDGSNWPLCGEIDIATLRGQAPGQILGSVIYFLASSQSRERNYTLPNFQDTFSKQFHVFSILWQEDQIDWYVDNHKYMGLNQAEIGNGWPFNQSFWFNISLAVGGSLVGPPDMTTRFPQTMQIDYVRYYTPE